MRALPLSAVRAYGHPTIGEVLDDGARAANSFDAIRLVAAAAVLVSHAFVLTTGSEAGEPLSALTGGRLSIGFVAVGVFFSISGFLIDRSLERSRSLATFTIKRCLRILPGLWVSLALTVGFAAAFISADGWHLFLRASTWHFLANGVLAPASPLLPGAFEHAPAPQAFNGSLWTLKHEAACYAITVLAASLGAIRRPAVVSLWVVSLIAGYATNAAQASGASYHFLLLVDLFQFFGLGMIINQYRTRIPRSAAVALVLIGLWIAALWSPFAREATPLLLTYPVIALGASSSRLAHYLTARGDVSYGLYVYAFPVQQLMMQPSLLAPSPWAANIALALPATYLLAVLSWRYVEKPAIAFGAALIARTQRETVGHPRN